MIAKSNRAISLINSSGVVVLGNKKAKNLNNSFE
jgi:hypothetical protein